MVGSIDVSHPSIRKSPSAVATNPEYGRIRLHPKPRCRSFPFQWKGEAAPPGRQGLDSVLEADRPVLVVVY
jgi:hypothetical protein